MHSLEALAQQTQSSLRSRVALMSFVLLDVVNLHFFRRKPSHWLYTAVCLVRWASYLLARLFIMVEVIRSLAFLPADVIRATWTAELDIMPLRRFHLTAHSSCVLHACPLTLVLPESLRHFAANPENTHPLLPIILKPPPDARRSRDPLARSRECRDSQERI